MRTFFHEHGSIDVAEREGERERKGYSKKKFTKINAFRLELSHSEIVEFVVFFSAFVNVLE